MIDWKSSMQQTFEFYVVDPATWKDERLLEQIESCTINRDLSNATLGSATIDSTEVLDECYIRVYLVAIQNGLKEKFPLGTFLVQTPSEGFDGKSFDISLDAYTPLIELKGDSPDLGYSILKGETIMERVSALCRDNVRAPVVPAKSSDTLYRDFVANLDDTWLSFLTDLMYNAKYQFALDELGRILFEPVKDTASLQSVWVYTDDDNSILHPTISNNQDLYSIPNVVEVIYATDAGSMISIAVNDDPNSPVSTVARGRVLKHRDTNPSIIGEPTQEQLDKYAVQLLRDLSCLEHTVTYTHGYCPVRIGDCVTLNYKRAGLVNVKAKVISQSIKCETGCQVEETAVYTTKLWR